MELPLVYAIALGGLLCLGPIFKLASGADRHVRSVYSWLVQKTLSYPLVMTRFQGSTNVSRLHGIFLVVYIAANAVCLALKIDQKAQLALRASRLFSLNVILLYAGGHTNYFCEWFFGATLEQYSLVHRWIGRVCVVEAIVHAAAAVAWQHNALERVNIILLITITALGASSVVFLRQWLYEVFVNLHVMLSAATLILLWIHITIQASISFICIAIASGMWILHTAVRLALLVYRNHGRIPHRIEIADVLPASSDTIMVTIKHKKKYRAGSDDPQEEKWSAAPGQYIYLTVPALARETYGILQSHPYFIVESNDERISMLVEKKRGFSRRLQYLAGKRVWIDGPYGGLYLDDFEKITFFASGIGISAHILAIRRLLEREQSRAAKVRRIVLAWVLESADQHEWAYQLVKELLLVHDKEELMTVLVHSTQDSEKDILQKVQTTTGHEHYTVFSKRYRLYFADIIKDLSHKVAGRMAVSVCGTPEFEDSARRALRLCPSSVTLFTTGFQPDETAASREGVGRYAYTKLPGSGETHMSQ